MKTVKMLNVMENLEVSITVNENVISIKDKEDKQLYFKIVEKNNKEINNIASTMINKHFEKGYVIMSTDIFDFKED